MCLTGYGVAGDVYTAQLCDYQCLLVGCLKRCAKFDGMIGDVCVSGI